MFFLQVSIILIYYYITRYSIIKLTLKITGFSFLHHFYILFHNASIFNSINSHTLHGHCCIVFHSFGSFTPLYVNRLAHQTRCRNRRTIQRITALGDRCCNSLLNKTAGKMKCFSWCNHSSTLQRNLE